MKVFSYVAKDSTGKTIKSSVQAESAQELLDKIHEKGFFCVSYRESGVKQSKVLHKFTTKELSFNCRQMSAMMSSGLTLVKALDILHREQEKVGAKQCWREIYEDVQKGQSFSESLQIQEGAFPPFLISMVNAGESSGSLDVVMSRMSEHYAKENKLNNKIKGALAYPIILLVLSLLIVIALFTFIMPTFMGMFGDAELPALTKFMLGISDFIRLRWYILVLFAVGIFLFITYMLKVPSMRLKFDKLLIKGPAFGKLIVKVYTGRFSRTFSSLYSSGIPMVECIERAVAVLGNSYISLQFKQVIDDVKQGQPLSSSIQKTGVFDSMFCSVIYVGEESGALDDILTKTSDYYEEESDSAISKLVGMIEPLMIIFMGAVIGLIIASIMPAMYSMFDSVQ